MAEDHDEQHQIQRAGEPDRAAGLQTAPVRCCLTDGKQPLLFGLHSIRDSPHVIHLQLSRSGKHQEANLVLGAALSTSLDTLGQ